MLAHDADDVMDFVVGEAGVPHHLDTGLDPNLALFSLAADVDMPALGQVEAEKADAVRAVWNGNARHCARMQEERPRTRARQVRHGSSWACLCTHTTGD